KPKAHRRLKSAPNSVCLDDSVSRQASGSKPSSSQASNSRTSARHSPNPSSSDPPCSEGASSFSPVPQRTSGSYRGIGRGSTENPPPWTGPPRHTRQSICLEENPQG